MLALVHHAVILEMTGPSYRNEEARKRGVARGVNVVDLQQRNLIFVDHVALTGLEVVGFAQANIDLLWIDTVD